MAVLQTDRLVLREPVLDDAGFIVELLNEPDFLRHIGDRKVRTDADAREYLRTGPMDSFKRHGLGLYVVELVNHGEAAGICGLVQRDWLDGVDLGFAFLDRYRRRGFAFESALRVMAHARQDLGLGRLLAVTTQDNTASTNLLEKLGFVREGSVTDPDDDEELLLWAARIG
jgi:RimJ/RimL family protein N-acetyltransferase